MSTLPNSIRELTSGELDDVGGGHTVPPAPPLSTQIAELPEKTVGVVGAAAAIPGDTLAAMGTPNGGLLGLGG